MFDWSGYPILLRLRAWWFSLRWVSLRRAWYRATRKLRLWRMTRVPRIPLDDDLFQLACDVAERTDDILSSIRRSGDAEMRQWFQNVQPKIREVSTTAFRLIGTAQELRGALAKMNDDPRKAMDALQAELDSESDPEFQRFVDQTLRSEQKKIDSLAQSKRNLRLISVKLGAITSFLDSIYLRVPNVKVMADRQDWFAELSTELDHEIRGLEEALDGLRPTLSERVNEFPAKR